MAKVYFWTCIFGLYHTPSVLAAWKRQERDSDRWLKCRYVWKYLESGFILLNTYKIHKCTAIEGECLCISRESCFVLTKLTFWIMQRALFSLPSCGGHLSYHEVHLLAVLELSIIFSTSNRWSSAICDELFLNGNPGIFQHKPYFLVYSSEISQNTWFFDPCVFDSAIIKILYNTSGSSSCHWLPQSRSLNRRRDTALYF